MTCEPPTQTNRLEALESAWIENCRHRKIRSADDVPVLIGKLRAEMEMLQFPHMDVFAVRTAVREAVLNAIEHGQRDDLSTPVNVTFLVTPDYVVAEVMDHGPGFDPSLVPNPMVGNPKVHANARGRGLFLMRMLMTWVRFSKPGNVCILFKQRSSSMSSSPPNSGAPKENESCDPTAN